jgi:hypothetical protein
VRTVLSPERLLQQISELTGDEVLEIKQQWIMKVLTDHTNQIGQFIVITDRGIRIRRLPML